MAEQRNVLTRSGDRLSAVTSRLFAHPAMQLGLVLACAGWFVIGYRVDLLTAVLSILAITLTQMVLNGQYARESEAYRRDVAMHAKLDELIKATRRARDEMAGIEEELEEEEIRALREEAKELIDRAARHSGEEADGDRAKAAIDRVGDGRV